MKKFAINIEESDYDFVPLLKGFLNPSSSSLSSFVARLDSPLTFIHGKDICVSPVNRDNVPVLTLPEDWRLFKKYINQKDDEAINVGDWVEDGDGCKWMIVEIKKLVPALEEEYRDHEYCYFGKNKEYEDMALCDLNNEDYIHKIPSVSKHTPLSGEDKDATCGVSTEYIFNPGDITIPDTWANWWSSSESKERAVTNKANLIAKINKSIKIMKELKKIINAQV